LIVVFVAFAAAVPMEMTAPHATGMSAAFESWMIQHEKNYATEEEKLMRLQIFTDNAILVEEHNAKKLSWHMALNQFADITGEEFVAMQKLQMGTLGTELSRAPMRHQRLSASLPDAVDWRSSGAVTPVKNQGQCGSCWAFSTVVSLEGQGSRKYGNLTSYSEQNLVDCVKNVPMTGGGVCCDGCQGGLMDSAFQYMITKQDGMDDSEAAYPYRGADMSCAFNPDHGGPAVVKSYTDIAQGDEDSLKDAVANVGPVSVAVDANALWQLYGGGVFKPFFCAKNKLNHGVAAVGYGKQGTEEYWIIKNSWGTVWGEKGYMRMKLGVNECGVAEAAVYPVL